LGIMNDSSKLTNIKTFPLKERYSRIWEESSSTYFPFRQAHSNFSGYK